MICWLFGHDASPAREFWSVNERAQVVVLFSECSRCKRQLSSEGLAVTLPARRIQFDEMIRRARLPVWRRFGGESRVPRMGYPWGSPRFSWGIRYRLASEFEERPRELLQ